MATPEEVFWQAAETLAAEGIVAEFVVSCCRSCAAVDVDEGTDVRAVEKDGSLNDRRGWLVEPSGTQQFSDWLDWDVPAGWEPSLFLGVVAEHLRAVGFQVDVPEGEWQAIKVSLEVTDGAV